MMYSINYMHEGAGKIWYSIPAQDRVKFEQLAKRKHRKLYQKDPNFLFNLNTMICPDYLSKKGVTVYSTHQKQGEIILTFPASYHAGFSLGFNVAEAVNFTAPTWLEWSEKAMKIYMKSREKVPVFPPQWLILESGAHIPSFVENEVKSEIHFRNKVRKEYKNKGLEPSQFEQKLETQVEDDEVKHECKFCINLCYASFLTCSG